MANGKDLRLTENGKDVEPPSIFETFVQQIDIDTIPCNYIQKIAVQFKDGNIITLVGEMIDNPIPLGGSTSWKKYQRAHNGVANVQIYIDIRKLEKDVNTMYNSLFNN